MIVGSIIDKGLHSCPAHVIGYNLNIFLMHWFQVCLFFQMFIYLLWLLSELKRLKLIKGLNPTLSLALTSFPFTVLWACACTHMCIFICVCCLFLSSLRFFITIDLPLCAVLCLRCFLCVFTLTHSDFYLFGLFVY